MRKKTIIDGAYTLVRAGTLEHGINSGAIYSYVRTLVVNVGSSGNIILTTGDKPVDAFFKVSADEKLNASVHESPTFTGGTDVIGDISNFNRNHPDSQDLITAVVIDASVTVDGRLLGGSLSDKWEGMTSSAKMVLKPNTSYMFDLLFDKNDAEMYAGFVFAEGTL